MARPQMLIVLSSHASMTVDGKERKTGWFLPEFAHPHHVFAPHFAITTASPAGGVAPLDPWSVEFAAEDAQAQDFYKSESALWERTRPLSEFVGRAGEFAAIFYVGGHGPMFDLARDETSMAVVREFWEAGKTVAAVCHGPIALANVKLSDGSFLVDGSAVTGFTNAEEDQVELTKAMPFLLEDVLKTNGAKFESADPWGVKVVAGKEGRLYTGQNPQSATPIAEAIVEKLIGGK